MMTELDQLHYNDLMADLASAIEAYGARKVLEDFKFNYPNHYSEVFVQMNRSPNMNKIPVLLMKRNASPM